MGKHEDDKRREVPKVEIYWPGQGSDHIARGFDTSPRHVASCEHPVDNSANANRSAADSFNPGKAKGY